jgi:AP-4 complex subunit epsilon-1
MRSAPELQVIVEKMVEYLRGVTDDVAKADVVQRISDLAERYAPDTQWFIDTMNQVGFADLHSHQWSRLVNKALG